MKTITLEAFRDEMTGETGLGVKGMPRDETTNAALDGLTIAHDLIEHVNGPERIGTIDDELEALGAIWYVRGQHGELRRDGAGSRYTPEENLAADVSRMFRDHVDGGQYVADAPRTRPCEDIETTIDDVLAACDWRGEFNGGECPTLPRWEAYARIVRARMRMGYRKARRKWERRGRYAANNQFWAIADAVGPCVKHIEMVGQQFRLTYGDGKAYCEEYYGEDY